MRLKRSPFPLLPETGHISVGDRLIGYAVTRSVRRKRTIAFRLEAAVGIRVHAPVRTKLHFIHKQLQDRAPWFARKLAEQARHSVVAAPFSVDRSITYCGHACAIRVTHNITQGRQCRLQHRSFIINIPDDGLTKIDLTHDVRLELLLWLKRRARALFQKRADYWADKLGVDYSKLSVTDPKQQWGSCNGRNAIRLSWRLMLSPLPIIDYVVAHELCHVPHKNHGPHFWATLASVMPDYQARRQRLRLIGPALTL